MVIYFHCCDVPATVCHVYCLDFLSIVPHLCVWQRIINKINKYTAAIFSASSRETFAPRETVNTRSVYRGWVSLCNAFAENMAASQTLIYEIIGVRTLYVPTVCYNSVINATTKHVYLSAVWATQANILMDLSNSFDRLIVWGLYRFFVDLSYFKAVLLFNTLKDRAEKVDNSFIQ